MSQGLRVPQGGGFREMAMQSSAQGLRAYASQHPNQKTEITPPDKTFGGGVMAAAGMGIAGLGAASTLGVSATTAGLGGLGLGVLAYMLS